jgi:hypothetical protein
MSSVTRFIKQVTPGMNVIAPPVIANLYEFVPTTSNTTGNYPPGAMVLASNSPTILAYLTGQGYVASSSGWIARDMGKTIKASIATNETNASASPPITTSNTEQHWRMIQLLRPVAGNTDGASGVQGAATTPNGYTDYVTLYVPTSIAFSGNILSVAQVLVGGQM